MKRGRAITQAEGYALERVNRSEGEVRRFLDILTEYEKAPDVTRRRMYLEASADLIGRIEHLVVIDESQKNMLPLFDLNAIVTAAAPTTKNLEMPSTPSLNPKSEEGR